MGTVKVKCLKFPKNKTHWPRLARFATLQWKWWSWNLLFDQTKESVSWKLSRVSAKLGRYFKKKNNVTTTIEIREISCQHQLGFKLEMPWHRRKGIKGCLALAIVFPGSQFYIPSMIFSKGFHWGILRAPSFFPPPPLVFHPPLQR